MEAILDTNFIISCIRKRIDFLSQLEEMGFKPVVPREVIEELKDLKKRPGESFEDRTSIGIAFRMFDDKKIKKITLGSGKVDDMLIKKGKEGVYIATLDAVIKRSVPNKIVISEARNALEIVRD
jgi:rRNA-processing protein FCF1